ncbi:MAG: hypothetical protein ACRD0U_06310 [Acidimicrobiales bacterium]
MIATFTVRTPWERDTVARRVHVAPSSLVEFLSRDALPRAGDRLPLGGAGMLRIDEGLAAAEPTVTWRSTGRLYGRGPRLAVYARVELRLTAWSDQGCELRVCPIARHVARWGDRRQRRYFALAHQAADDVVRLLKAAAAQRTEPARCWRPAA